MNASAANCRPETAKVIGLPLSRDPQALRTQLEADFALMKDYLQMCVRKEDWHGVMDASADIREIVSKLSVLAD